MTAAWRCVPALVLLAGVGLVRGHQPHAAVGLRVPLASAVPARLLGFDGRDLELPEEQRRVAGVSTYLLRRYVAPAAAGTAEFAIYVGYYERQTQGRTIHSPKNCLPGAGWEPVTSRRVTVTVGGRATALNRYLVQNGERRALVLYWYQGRGRIQASEYRVKWSLLRDAALLGRTEEALVRVVIPVRETEAAADELGLQVARALVPAVEAALPPLGSRATRQYSAAP